METARICPECHKAICKCGDVRIAATPDKGPYGERLVGEIIADAFTDAWDSIVAPVMRYGRSDAEYIRAHAVWFDFGIVRLTYEYVAPPLSPLPLVEWRPRRTWVVAFRDGNQWRTGTDTQDWSMNVTMDGQSVYW